MRMQLRQEMQNYELQTASKTLLCSCFQPPAKGDEALPDQWKFLFTSRAIRSGSMMHVADHMDFWNANLQSPFFLERLYELLA